MKRVALTLQLNKDFNRRIAAGVADYAHAERWSVYLEDHPELSIPRLSQWGGDGIITNPADVKLGRLIARMKMPVVAVGGGSEARYLGGRRILQDAPYVLTDDETIGQMAAGFLVERGFRHLAYCGYRPGVSFGWSVLRGEAFAEAARQAGISIAVFRPRVGDPRRWDVMMSEMVAWLTALPKPVGILTADDMRACHVLQAAREARIPVPVEAAVMGADNDPLACRLSDPPLTSIDLDAERIGREAAELLDRLIHGKPVPRVTLIPPLRIEPRDSTAVHVDADPLVEKALACAAKRLAEGIQAREVAEICGVSLVTLNKHFEAARGLTLAAWIRNQRLREICRLIEETDLPLKEVARRTGLGSAAYLCNLYRSTFGRTPRQAGTRKG